MKLQVTETVNIAQAKTTLEQTARLYFSRDKKGGYRMDRRRARPVCLIGPAGVGKTEIVRQVARELDLAFLSYSVTHHTRQSAIGLPRLAETQVDGVTVSVTEYTMSEIIAEVYRVMNRTGKKEGILFLDEFNCASETMRPIMLQLLQAKTFGPHAIPEGWMLVLAGNPPEYNAAASALDAVTADRMRLIHLRPDYSAWREYMVKHKIHPIILSYLDDHKRHFYVFEKGNDGTALVTARAWEDLSVILRMMEEQGFEVDLPFVAQYLQSSQVAREFITYYRQYAAIIAEGTPDRILNEKPTKELVSRVDAMSFLERWALTSILLLRLEAACEAEGNEARADAMLERAILFFDRYLAQEPQNEFLLNGVTNCVSIASLIAKTGNEAYRAAAEKMFFSGNTPNVRELKKLIS